MNPITFLFNLLGPRLTMSPDDAQVLQQKAFSSYEGSVVQKFIDKHWYLALLLPIILPIVQAYLNQFLDSLIPDEDEDGDHDIADALAVLQRALSKPQQQAA